MLGEVEAEISKLQRVADALRDSISINGATGSAPGNAKSNTTGSTTGKKRTLSAEARKKISLAQKARWAKSKTKNATNGAGANPKPKRTMSAAARKRIAAAQRARWAKFKLQQKKAA
jgi:hypothetical protein